jgi:hypothetical protein
LLIEIGEFDDCVFFFLVFFLVFFFIGDSFSLDVTIRGTDIILSSPGAPSQELLKSPTDAAASIINRVARHILSELHTQAVSLLGSTNVHRRGAAILFKLDKSGSQSVATVSVVPLKSLAVDVQVSVENAFGEVQDDLVWSEIPGGDHVQKITQLILAQGATMASTAN